MDRMRHQDRDEAAAETPAAGGGDPATAGEASAVGVAGSEGGSGGRTAAAGSAPRAGFGRWLWEWTKSLAVALLLFLFVRTFIVEAFQIPTASMENTLLVGDFLLVNKMVYGAEIPGTDIQLPGFGDPARGDIVVFEPPSTAGQPPRTNYVKRIVGAPGDTLSMVDGTLYRNGRPMEEPYVKNGTRSRDLRSPDFSWQRSHLAANGRRTREYRPTRDNWGPLVVPPDSVFVMGDNRQNSQDSRYWGYVAVEAIKGKPIVIYYSYDRRTADPFRWLTDIRWDRLLSAVQ